MKNETEQIVKIRRRLIAISIAISLIVVVGFLISPGKQFYKEMFFYSEELNQELLEDAKNNLIKENAINFTYFEEKGIECELDIGGTIFSEKNYVYLYSPIKNVEVDVIVKKNKLNPATTTFSIDEISYPSKTEIVLRATIVLALMSIISVIFLTIIIEKLLEIIFIIIKYFHNEVSWKNIQLMNVLFICSCPKKSLMIQ